MQHIMTITLITAACLLLSGCGGGDTKSQSQPAPTPPAQTQSTGQTTANPNDEKAFKASCQEIELRGFNNAYSQYVNKPVHTLGPITEVQKLSDNKVRVKIQYPDTDAVWVTAEKPLLTQPKVGKRVEFWGILRGKGDKSKLPEISAPYINVL